MCRGSMHRADLPRHHFHEQPAPQIFPPSLQPAPDAKQTHSFRGLGARRPVVAGAPGPTGSQIGRPP